MTVRKRYSAGNSTARLRDFAKEVGIIVVGVVIALAGEQAMERLHWQQAVKASRENLSDNAETLVDSAATRELMSPCIGNKLAEVGRVVDSASSSGRLPAINFLGAPGYAPSDFSSLDNAVAAQVTPHLTREQIGNYASISVTAAQLRAASAEELSDWADLFTIVRPGRRFGDAEQARSRGALSRAMLAAKNLRRLAGMLPREIQEAGLLSDDQIKVIRAKAAQTYAGYMRDGLLLCKSLDQGPPADHYGQAPSPVDLSQPFKA